jgi:glycerol-1-phosphate dehydrogenase [NAD(P)+]
VTKPISPPSTAEQGRADPLAALLTGTYRDPETGAAAGVATRALAIEPSLAGREAELVAPLGLGDRIAVVSDANTHPILGQRVERALEGRAKVTSIVLEGRPHPDDATTARIRAATRDATGYIAVGSGTINDLTKYASAAENKPYAVFGTAPSMNGYTSLTASITQHGHKLTLPAHAPLGAFFDLSVLAAAPKPMIRAGLGDSICRTTAQADWLLSHMLRGTPYRLLPYDLLGDDEPALLEGAEALVNGDLGAMRTLVRTLVLAGFGTAIIGQSAPASQGEHLISHFIDMMEPPERPPVLHGEQVGVTTLSIARLYEAMFDRRPTIAPDTRTPDDIRNTFGDDLASSVWPEFDAKRLDRARADTLKERLAADWDKIREAIGKVLLPARRIEAVLKAAGAPLTPEAVHLRRPFYETALAHAREIRNRYTILDLAAQSGRLAGLIPSL